jgi:hypothetical protein
VQTCAGRLWCCPLQQGVADHARPETHIPRLTVSGSARETSSAHRPPARTPLEARVLTLRSTREPKRAPTSPWPPAGRAGHVLHRRGSRAGALDPTNGRRRHGCTGRLDGLPERASARPARGPATGEPVHLEVEQPCTPRQGLARHQKRVPAPRRIRWSDTVELETCASYVAYHF